MDYVCFFEYTKMKNASLKMENLSSYCINVLTIAVILNLYISHVTAHGANSVECGDGLCVYSIHAQFVHVLSALYT